MNCQAEQKTPQWIALLRTNLERDEKLAKLQRGMVAVCQVAESLQLRNHFCYTFEHKVSMEAVKRVIIIIIIIIIYLFFIIIFSPLSTEPEA